ncbi:hepatitis A virus cellular receptor 2 homolog [Sparus aurata]|uniref:hepatitis A virus cellular receptor 2 homolog n=1 Tax=Sparus aurata TaxID=8175 RepID=UPI0011C12DB4|nr:hepatitis A virus cellular receptor 2 homolog [Sparus aurata]
MAPLLFLSFLLCEAGSGTVVIRVEPGQDVILPCDAGDVTITAAEWTRSDPKPSENILFWTDGHSDTPFKGRVYLVDDELKTRNVSLILKNVNREDNGTYECRVLTAGSRRNKRAINTDPISIVELQVTDPENQKEYISGGDIKAENSAPHHVGLGAAALGVLVCLTFSCQQI